MFSEYVTVNMPLIVTREEAKILKKIEKANNKAAQLVGFGRERCGEILARELVISACGGIGNLETYLNGILEEYENETSRLDDPVILEKERAEYGY